MDISWLGRLPPSRVALRWPGKAALRWRSLCSPTEPCLELHGPRVSADGCELAERRRAELRLQRREEGVVEQVHHICSDRDRSRSEGVGLLNAEVDVALPRRSQVGERSRR